MIHAEQQRLIQAARRVVLTDFGTLDVGSPLARAIFGLAVVLTDQGHLKETTMTNGQLKRFTDLGFVIWDTGGQCKCLGLNVKNGLDIGVTNKGGTDLPLAIGPALVTVQRTETRDELVVHDCDSLDEAVRVCTTLKTLLG